MIRNIVLTKKGNESEDQARRVFTAEEFWEDGGQNLIVYINSKPVANKNYTIISNNEIELNSSVSVNDEISFVITQLVDPFYSADYENRAYSIDRVEKKLENKAQTSINKRVFEENINSHLHLHSDDIWTEKISSDPEQAEEDGVAQSRRLFQLTEDVTVQGERGWYPQDPNNPGVILNRWIPRKYGKAYVVRLYDFNNSEIPSSDPMGWKWDYETGYLTIQNDHSYKTPFKISGYRYVGKLGVASLTHWKEPVFSLNYLPKNHNDHGDIRLILTENLLYKWDAYTEKWDPLEYGSGSFKDPVLNRASLPSKNNVSGDIRLVMEDNDLYVWDFAQEDWVLLTGLSFDESAYYRREDLDRMLAEKSEIGHTHDTIYYRKNDIDEMLQWRPSRATKNDLPPYSENQDGDVILTRDDNTVWRWYSGDPNINQGHWEPILQANFSWKSVVEHYSDLPSINNVVGDVRFVLETEKMYYWTGDRWYSIHYDMQDHHHDNLYIRKENLRWKEPVESVHFLPEDAAQGDIRLVLNKNILYSYDNDDGWVALNPETTWKNTVQRISDLPTVGNGDNDIIFVKETKKIYSWDPMTETWNDVLPGTHDHNDVYYTKDELDEEINDIKSLLLSHTHDGVDSERIDYNSLLNIPYFHWKAPVSDHASLPYGDNTVGDAKIVLNEKSIYIWDGANWEKVSSGTFELDELDNRYYTKQELDATIDSIIASLTSQIALKADYSHNHDDRYYTQDEINQMFNDFNPQYEHDHDDRYYTQDQLGTPGQAQIHWDNISPKPSFEGVWKSPVNTINNLPDADNQENDLRLILDSSEFYEWKNGQWNYVGKWEIPQPDYWKIPVETIADLPSTDNADGDIRLVLEENILYRWDGPANNWVSFNQNGQTVIKESNNFDDVQVYINGIQETPDDEWQMEGDYAVRILHELEQNDHVTIIVFKDDDHRRFDYVVTDVARRVYDINPFYFRQDIIVTTPSAEFTFPLDYTPGNDSLIVWKNGLRQKVNDDYYEKTPFSIEFFEPCIPGDKIIVVIIGKEIGDDRYLRESFAPISYQSIFNLENEYAKNTDSILVYLNGVLQTINDDYFELSPTSIEFVDPVAPGEEVTVIILEAAEITNQDVDVVKYFREDYDVTAVTDREYFTVNHEYIVGAGELLVYLNGQLQRVNNDYYEIDNHTIRFHDPVQLGDLVTFIVIKGVIPGTGSLGAQYATDLKLGNPSDTSWNDGYIPLSASMTTADAIDGLNEALLQFIPDPPRPLSSSSLVPNIEMYSGYVSADNSNIETYPGDYVDYIIYERSFDLTIDKEEFSDADNGLLELYMNGSLLDSFDLAGAFVEDNRNGSQILGKYGSVAGGAAKNVGSISFAGGLRMSTNSNIHIMSVKEYNDFSGYQVGNILIKIFNQNVRDGYNSVVIHHKLGNSVRMSETFKFFMDDSSSHPSFIGTQTLTPQPISSQKYLSGVRYFSIGDEFRVKVNISNLFFRAYVDTPFTYEMVGMKVKEIDYDDAAIEGVSSIPKINDIIEYDDTLKIDKYNEYSIDSRGLIRTYTPIGEKDSYSYESLNIMINTYTNGSTNLIEYFHDETFRLPSGDYDTLPPARSGAWDSTQPLTINDAIIFDKKLQYANIDFSDYLPSQAVNYSLYDQEQYYFRSFYKPVPRNNGKIIMGGIHYHYLKNSKIIIDIKLPMQTGWLSLNNYYDVSDFTGADGDGCLVDYDDEEHAFYYSSGTFSTANSGYLVIMRITFLNSTSSPVSYLEMEW